VKYSEEEIKKKLLLEFKDLDRLKNDSIRDSDAVIVLAAEETQVTGENKERVEEGLKIVKNKQNNPKLFFLGTKIHNRELKKYLDKKITEIIYIESKNDATTKVQIKDFAKLLAKNKFKKALFVSHFYHIPRIKRYCHIYLKGLNSYFWKIGTFNQQNKQVEEEIQKIIKYASKGDLSLFI